MQIIKESINFFDKIGFSLPGKLYCYFIENRKSILFFLLIGIISATVNLGSFGIMWKWIGMNYQLAVSIAYILSVIVHFSANRCIAFERRDKHFVRQLPRYFATLFVSFCVTLIVTRFVVEVLSWTPYLGIVMSIGITININYLMLRYWVFPKTAKATSGPR